MIKLLYRTIKLLYGMIKLLYRRIREQILRRVSDEREEWMRSQTMKEKSEREVW
jgi:hypothetical protein